MKHNIWIMNHYATNMFFNQGGRHHWFAENLRKKGYNPTIFCANTRHNVQNQDSVEIPSGKYTIKHANGIPYVFVKTVNYSGNSIRRVINMFFFYKNLFPAARGYAKAYGKPDVILASSVHPLTMMAGIQISKKFHIPCICEVRDLWPETLVAMDVIKRYSIPAKLLYTLEKFIYKKADRLIFTMEGGKEYIKDKGWDKEIVLDKIYYINNGADLEEYNLNKKKYIYNDIDLDDNNNFKVLFTGAIGKANTVFNVIRSAEILYKNKGRNIKLFIFGDGPEKQDLEIFVKNNMLKNVVFKGRVDKKYIPNILSKSNLNLFSLVHLPNLFKYGLSPNKMFDYFTSGRPVLSNVECRYDLLEKYNCGITVKGNSPKALVDGILKFYKMPKEEYNTYCQNALKAAEDFDFKVLTDKLEKVILELI